MKTLYLGNVVGSNQRLNFPLESMKKHLAVFGGSGSGKTVLSKLVVEECMIERIPAILVDPQGDLASLAIKHHNVVIFTPASTKGVPICINPLKKPSDVLDQEDFVNIVNQITSTITKLLGYKDNDAGKSASSALFIILQHCWKNDIEIGSFDGLVGILSKIPDQIKAKTNEIITDQELKALIKKIKYLTIGSKKLLFDMGTPLDIDVLLDKDRVSIIYLNSLYTEEEKQFFVSMLATELYQWMLGHPKQSVQALFYIDEVSTFIPAGSIKPITKPILKLIYKQARKYGIGCIVSTQNPGDIDYTAFAQFGTWAIGRLTTKQDRAKVVDALKSLTSDVKVVEEKLPSLNPGEFMLFSPDSFTDIKHFKARMIDEHRTLTEEDVKGLTTEEIRKQFNIPEKKEAAPGTNGGVKRFDIKISQTKAYDIIERKKRKLFLFAGPALENVIEVKLVLKPLLKAIVKQVESKLMGLRKKVKEYIIFFNEDGPTTILKNFPDFIKLYEMSDTEVAVFKNLEKNMTTHDLSGKTSLSENQISNALAKLQEKKLVTKVGKQARAILWTTFGKFTLPSLSRLNVVDIETSTKKAEGQIMKIHYDEKAINEALNKWYGACEIIDSEIIYYPYYEFTLAGRKKKRKIKISAVDGRVIQ